MQALRMGACARCIRKGLRGQAFHAAYSAVLDRSCDHASSINDLAMTVWDARLVPPCGPSLGILNKIASRLIFPSIIIDLARPIAIWVNIGLSFEGRHKKERLQRHATPL